MSTQERMQGRTDRMTLAMKKTKDRIRDFPNDPKVPVWTALCEEYEKSMDAIVTHGTENPEPAATGGVEIQVELGVFKVKPQVAGV